MKKSAAVIAMAAALGVISVPAAEGLVYEATNKPYINFRKDIAKQIGKLVLCMGKAAGKCFKATDPNSFGGTGPWCSITDPNTSAGIAADDIEKYGYALQRCVDKVDPAKKQPDGMTSAQAYSYITDPNVDPVLGCPGDLSATDMASFETYIINEATFLVDMGVQQIPPFCSLDVADPAGCVQVIFKAIKAGTKGFFKCAEKCESDYKDAKGNGGPNDDLVCCSGDTGYGTCDPDTNFKACRDGIMFKAAAQAEKNEVASFAWGTYVGPYLELAIDTYMIQIFDATPNCP